MNEEQRAKFEAKFGKLSDWDLHFGGWQATLASQAPVEPAQEPVAWRDPRNQDPGGQAVTFDPAVHDRWPHIYSTPLYTKPQPTTGEADRVDTDLLGLLKDWVNNFEGDDEIVTLSREAIARAEAAIAAQPKP